MPGEKRTRKFESRKLQATIKQRRAHKAATQKIKQRERKREHAAPETDEAETSTAPSRSEDLGFDAFIGGGEFAKELQKELERGGHSDDDAEENLAADGQNEDGAAVEGSSDVEGDEGEQEEGDDALAKHKAQLEALRKSDPEFVKHLEQNEPGLLHFGDDDDDDEGDTDGEGVEGEEGDGELVEEEEDEDDGKGKGKKAKSDAMPASADEVQELGEAAVESQASLKRLMRVFANATKAGHTAAKSSRAFDALLALTLTQMPALLASHLKIDLNALEALTHSQLARTPHWTRLQRMVKSHLAHLVHLLTSLTEPSLLAFALAHTRRLSVFFSPFPRMALKYLKVCLIAWASSDSAPALSAFMAVRDLARTHSPAFADSCLRHAYLTYVRHAAFPSPQRAPSLQFMLNGLAELIAPAPARAYPLAFVSLRELALLMRRAVQSKAKEATSKVVHWAYLHALRVWARIVTEHAHSTAQMTLLVYPLMQLLEGLVLLSSSPGLFPLRLHATRLMVDVTRGTRSHASPVAALLEILDSPLIRRKARLASTAQTRPPDLALLIRAAPSVVDTRAYQDAVLHTTLHTLLDYMAVHATSVAFPELCAPIVAWLRRWIKSGVRASDASQQARQLVERLESQRRWLLQRRSANAATSLAPADEVACAAFLASEQERSSAPLAKFAAHYGTKHQELVSQRTAKAKKMRVVPKKHKKPARSEDDSDDLDDLADLDEEEDGEMKEEKRAQKKKAHAHAQTPQKSRQQRNDAGEDDLVEDLVLSDPE